MLSVDLSDLEAETEAKAPEKCLPLSKLKQKYITALAS